jgi:DNA repair photolyase
MAVRFGRLAPDQWKEERIRWKDVKKSYRLMKGSVMFPSSHDITENNFLACFIVLRKLLEAGNRVLIVSKPHMMCVKRICDDLRDHQGNILFRFTITARDDGILSFWEANAPDYEERKECLKYAYDQGYATSVSVEPMLDPAHIKELVDDLSPFITDSIWIGKLNMIRHRVAIDSMEAEEEIRRIEESQTDEKIRLIYEDLRENPLIKWKESIRSVTEQNLV